MTTLLHRRRWPGRVARWFVTACSLALLSSCAAEPPSPKPAGLTGTWRAEMEHGGETGEIVVRFEEASAGGLSATLSLPTIDAWDFATLPVAIDGDRVNLGFLALVRDPDGGLSGVLPEALVPVYEIPFTLRRTDAVERPEREDLDAPRAAPVWVRELESPVWAGLAFRGGSVFVGSDDGKVRALQAETGEVLWETATGGPVRARPTPAREGLLVHSDDGVLYALDPESGAVRWQSRVEEAPVERVAVGAPESRYDHYGSSAVSEGGTVYVGSHEGALHALDAATGARRWTFEVGDAVTSTPALSGGRVFIGSFDGNVYAVDATTGQELWRYGTGGGVPSSPAVAGEVVIVGSRSYDLVALDAALGRPVWTRYVWYSWIESSATVRDGNVYVGSSDAQALHALDAVTGELGWRFDLGGSGWGQPAVTEEAVYLGAVGVADYLVDHRGALVAVDRTTGQAIWRWDVDRPDGAKVWGVAASPSAGAGRVFAADLAGRVVAFGA